MEEVEAISISRAKPTRHLHRMLVPSLGVVGALALLVRNGASASSPSLNLPSNRGLAFVVARRHLLPLHHQSALILMRGGATAVDDESDAEDEAEVEQSDDDEKEELDEAALAASAVKAAIKTKVKQELAKKEASKKAVNAKLQREPKAKNSSSSSFFRIPYIVRALLNPVTVFKMSVAYWASLFNLDYLTKDPALELRSAVEEKAKSSGSSGGGGSAAKGKRKMKRGQAKSLSDLPQLSS